MVDENFLRKLRALNAKANDDSVTEEEAALYAKKVSEMLAAHNLSEAALEVQPQMEPVREEPLRNTWMVNPWAREIAQAVGALYFCDIFWRTRGQVVTIYFVGKPHNVEVAKSMTHYLVSTVTRLALAYATSPTAMRDDGYTPVKARNGFQRGAARRLAHRLWAMKFEQTSKEPPRYLQNNNPGNLPALYESEAQQIDTYLKQNHPNLRPSRGRGSDASGGHAVNGARAADGISLNAQLTGKANATMIGSK